MILSTLFLYLSFLNIAHSAEPEVEHFIDIPVEVDCPDVEDDDGMIVMSRDQSATIAKYCIQLGQKISTSAELADPEKRKIDPQIRIEDIDEEVLKKIAKKEGKWAIRFYFGPTSTSYFNTDIKIATSKYQLELKNVSMIERTSNSHYKVWEKLSSVKTAPALFQFIDEPTNTAVVSFGNKKHKYNINLVIFHPKILIVDGEEPRTHTQADVTGTFDGAPVHGEMNLQDLFGAYRLTYGYMNIKVQFEKEVPIFKLKNGGGLSYLPGVSSGVFTGYADIHFRIPGVPAWKETDKSQPAIAPIGYSLSASNRLVYTFPGEFLSLSIAHELTYGKLKYRVFDGTGEMNVNNQTITVSAGFRLKK